MPVQYLTQKSVKNIFKKKCNFLCICIALVFVYVILCGKIFPHLCVHVASIFAFRRCGQSLRVNLLQALSPSILPIAVLEIWERRAKCRFRPPILFPPPSVSSISALHATCHRSQPTHGHHKNFSREVRFFSSGRGATKNDLGRGTFFLNSRYG